MSLAELKDRHGTLAGSILTVPVEEGASAGDRTIQVVEPGKLFMVYGFYLKSTGTGVSVVWKSGATALTGTIALATSDVISVFSDIPILKGRAKGDDLILNLSATQAVVGWVTLTVASF